MSTEWLENFNARYPGCSVKFEHPCDESGVDVKVRLVTYSVQRLTGPLARRASDPALGPGVLGRAADDAAEAAMVYAAAQALPFIGLDWSKLFKLGLPLQDERHERGEVVFVDCRAEAVRIRWRPAGRRSTEDEFSFQDVLERLEDRRWRLA